jgi:hypothetical protein
MTDFLRNEPQYPYLPAALCDWDPGFASSPEAAVIAEDFDLPTVVADSFGEYVLRLARDPSNDVDLERALDALERMATSDDRAIQDCAVTGLVERLRSEAPQLIDALRPASADLYRRWESGQRWEAGR